MKKRIPCPEWTRQLTLNREDFSPSEWISFETHLRTCQGCLARRAEYGVLLSDLQTLPPPESKTPPDLPLPPRLWQQEEASGVCDVLLLFDVQETAASPHQAKELFLSSRYQEALDACNQILFQDSEHAEMWILKSNILVTLGRSQEALIACEQAVRLYPHEVVYLSTKAHILCVLKRYEEAVHVCDAALTFPSQKGNIWKMKCRCLLGLRRYREALEACSRALEGQTEDVDLWHIQALAPFLLEREEDGEGEDLLLLDPNYVTDPHSIERWADRARLLALENPQRYENALDACNQALQLNPSRKKLWEMKERILIALGRCEDALEVLKQSIARHPSDAEEWRFLGCVYNRLGCYEEARGAFWRAKELDPHREHVWGQTTASLLSI